MKRPAVTDTATDHSAIKVPRTMERPADTEAATDDSAIEVPTIDIEVRLVSGELVAQLNVATSTTGDDLRGQLQEHVKEGQRIDQIICNSNPITSESLCDVGVADGDPPHVVNLSIAARPALYMFEPCSTTELAERFVKLNDFGDVADIPVFKESRPFKKMDAAPLDAREFAQDLKDVLGPEFQKMFPSPFGGFLQGHVIVITDVQPGTGLDTNVVPDSMRVSDLDAMKLALCEALGGINESAFENIGFEDKDEYLRTGVELFAVDFGDDDCPFLTEADCEDLDEVVKRKAKLAQKDMAEQLTKHFSLSFDCDAFKLFPEIYGGFTKDGSVVGILRGQQYDA